MLTAVQVHQLIHQLVVDVLRFRALRGVRIPVRGWRW
jgi:hypothetical protein